MRSVTLVVPGDVNSLSPNRRLHWRERHRRECMWKDVTLCIWREAGSPWIGERVRFTFTIRRARSLDPGNALRSYALVAVENALKGLAFPDDDLRHLEYGPLQQEIGREWKGREEVVVRLEAVER